MRRLNEHRQALSAGPAGSQVLDLQEFKNQPLQLATRGISRRALERMMRVDVFEALSKEGPTFRYEFLPQHPLHELQTLPPPAFIARLFDGLLETVADDRNYADSPTFDRSVFQKFVAVMFCS